MLIFEFLRKLGNRQKEGKQPILQEMLNRSREKQESYEQWVQSGQKKLALSVIQQQYEAFQMSKGDNSKAVFLQTSQSKGFLYYFDEQVLTKKDFQHIFDDFKAQILPLNYTTYVSDVKHYTRANYVETIERHYLKPRFNWDEATNLSKQLYGNILIEHVLHDNHPKHLKLLCNYYSDRRWENPLPFEQLMNILLL